MLELLKERKEWAEKVCNFPLHFHLIQILAYSQKAFVALTYPTEAELEFYAKHEQALIEANKP